jgi:hypothetical protein
MGSQTKNSRRHRDQNGSIHSLVDPIHESVNNSHSTIQACFTDLVDGPGNRSERKRGAAVKA